MDDRLDELRARALAADVEPVSDPAELTRRSVQAHIAETLPFLAGMLSSGDATFTRWAHAKFEPFVRGQRITITHGGDFTGEYRVTDVRPNADGSETYTLEPA